MDHKEILLYGFHFSFIFIFSLAVVRDLLFVHYLNASVNGFALIVSILSYYQLHCKGTKQLSAYLIMFVAVFPLYFLIYFNHFGNLVIIYVVLLPLVAFFLLGFKQALFVSFIMYLLLVGMLYFIHIISPQAPILHNPLALINIVFASILVLLFGIFYHLAIDSSLNALIHSNRQKDILLKEVHHRVKNNLNVIASILGLQAMQETQEVSSHLLKSKLRIEAIAIVHEILYKQDNFGKIVFNDYIEKLSYSIFSLHGYAKDIPISIEENGGITMSLERMLNFGIIVNEMLTNTLKHIQKENLYINISLVKVDNEYIFKYKDNGSKYVDIQEIKHSKGLGLKLIYLSVKQLDSKLTIHYDNGLEFQMRFDSDV